MPDVIVNLSMGLPNHTVPFGGVTRQAVTVQWAPSICRTRNVCR